MFWEPFYVNFSRHFLPENEKHFFVFTDRPHRVQVLGKNITGVYQRKLGWPFDTLYRFKMFSKIEDQLKNFDYIFFTNANMLCVQNIGREVMPSENQGLTAVIHPGFWNKTRDQFTYETNKQSLAYIPEDAGQHYFMGGFNGGTAEAFLTLIRRLNSNIDQDLLELNHIAVWHDESHLNRYLCNKTINILSPSYGYPEGGTIPFEPKMLILDKNRFGGHKYMREDGIRGTLRKLKSAARWLIQKLRR